MHVSQMIDNIGGREGSRTPDLRSASSETDITRDEKE